MLVLLKRRREFEKLFCGWFEIKFRVGKQQKNIKSLKELFKYFKIIFLPGLKHRALDSNLKREKKKIIIKFRDF